MIEIIQIIGYVLTGLMLIPAIPLAVAFWVYR